VGPWAALGVALVVPLLWRRRPKNPSHKIVCQCFCTRRDEQGDVKEIKVQTFDDRADCGTLHGIACDTDGGTGKLEDCEKWSVPTSFIEKLIWGGRPEVKL
jgi:hypothetical protein